jgi:hypothetical protein
MESLPDTNRSSDCSFCSIRFEQSVRFFEAVNHWVHGFFVAKIKQDAMCFEQYALAVKGRESVATSVHKTNQGRKDDNNTKRVSGTPDENPGGETAAMFNEAN